jgi:alkylation response protein AidB-like acyl-CoA dehydrogenase
MSTPSAGEVAAAVAEVARSWRGERAERQARRHLEAAEFAALRNTGLLLLPVPVEAGGLWAGTAASVRGLCETYRDLAGADPSVALVSSMHPSVIAFWLFTSGDDPAWEAQRQAVFAGAVAGEQWGTITSEPGSGGDIARTRSTATPMGDGLYAVTGDKHFGSGSGVVDKMMTTAVPSDGEGPTIFVIDVRDRPWDGSAGMRLVAEWDGMGMRATQSHAMRLEGVPAERLAWSGRFEDITLGASPFIATIFTAVVLGVLDEAVGLARGQIAAKATELRAYEQVEWARAEQDHWLAVQAYEGALRALESGDPVAAGRAGIRAKEAVAELAEQTLLRLTRVLGGGTYSQRSPYAHWFEDVRALGFLRPPWGLAHDVLFLTSLL